MNDEKYDYYENVKSDFLDFLKENYDHALDDNEAQNAYDKAFVSDSVTGNASGSYFYSSWKAESALCHNFDLITIALKSVGESNIKSPQTLDVMVRCNILEQVFMLALREFNAGFSR